MNKDKILSKIMEKKEFSQLPLTDVEKVYSLFEKRQTSDEDKIKLTRDLLRKVYFAFGSQKLLNSKNKDEEWVLKKHISTKERFDFYEELYNKIFGKFKKKKISVIDLGAGVNGFSYNFMEGYNVNYIAIEAVGQLSSLMNEYFKKNNFDAESFHESLFNLEKISKIISSSSAPRILFLFKVIDSLEMLERNYSKKLLKKIIPLADLIVVSFATKSLISRKDFKVKRFWFENFVKENFNLVDDFELGSERYLLIANKKTL